MENRDNVNNAVYMTVEWLQALDILRKSDNRLAKFLDANNSYLVYYRNDRAIVIGTEIPTANESFRDRVASELTAEPTREFWDFLHDEIGFGNAFYKVNAICKGIYLKQPPSLLQNKIDEVLLRKKNKPVSERRLAGEEFKKRFPGKSQAEVVGELLKNNEVVDRDVAAAAGVDWQIVCTGISHWRQHGYNIKTIYVPKVLPNGVVKKVTDKYMLIDEVETGVRWITVAEASEMTGKAKSSIRRAIKKAGLKGIPYHPNGRKISTFREKDLLKLIQKMPTKINTSTPVSDCLREHGEINKSLAKSYGLVWSQVSGTIGRLKEKGWEIKTVNQGANSLVTYKLIKEPDSTDKQAGQISVEKSEPETAEFEQNIVESGTKKRREKKPSLRERFGLWLIEQGKRYAGGSR